eukprot:gene16625-19751_t
MFDGLTYNQVIKARLAELPNLTFVNVPNLRAESPLVDDAMGWNRIHPFNFTDYDRILFFDAVLAAPSLSKDIHSKAVTTKLMLIKPSIEIFNHLKLVRGNIIGETLQGYINRNYTANNQVVILDQGYGVPQDSADLDDQWNSLYTIIYSPIWPWLINIRDTSSYTPQRFECWANWNLDSLRYCKDQS